jgi:hypothetical protein
MIKITLKYVLLSFLAWPTSEALAGDDSTGIYAQDTEVRKLRITSMAEAESTRIKVLQTLHVAQAPVHSKQDKSSEAEIVAYAQAAARVIEFKEWLVRGTRVSVSLKTQGNSNDITNKKRFMKAAWAIHDAEIKTRPPFSRNDIGVTVKVMNDAREIFQLPVVLDSSRLDSDDR